VLVGSFEETVQEGFGKIRGKKKTNFQREAFGEKQVRLQL
jgi:hypothetical protein